MTRTLVETPEPPSGGRHAAPSQVDWGQRLRTFIRGVGQTLITFGFVVLLFVGYQLYVTDILNDREQNHARDELTQAWENGELAPGAPTGNIQDLDPGTGFAVMRIPLFGADWGRVVVQGTTDPALDIGPGHYVDSAAPGEIGNFSVAGHRVGKGSPFLDLDKLKAGDVILIETQTHTYTYSVLGDEASGDPEVAVGGVPGREIVTPQDVDVVAPDPADPTAEPTRSLLTLTTCHPKYSNNQRLIIHAELTDSQPINRQQ